MEKQISPIIERKLTHSIEKAASLALASPEKDRSELLAKMLLGDDIESKFAKTASAAFNRRITVLRFQKTADEHKAETFPLADPDTVLELMGGKPELSKAAAEAPVMEGAFAIEIMDYAEPQAKTASAPAARPLLEDTLNYQQFEKHIGSMLQANQAAFSRSYGELLKKSAMLDREREDVQRAISHASVFELQTLANVFGDRLQIPGMAFKKTAAAVNPHTELFDKVAAYLDHEDEYVAMHNALVEYKEGLEEFGKTAAAISQYMHKEAIGPVPTVLSSVIRTIPAATLAGTNMLEKIRQAGGDALATGYEQARAMNAAGTDVSVSPSSLLDADFLTRERFRDRLLAWSDMSADPILSKYGAEELFRAVQKAMDTHPALERPDHREVLRTYVSQLLPQNGMQSLADISALDTMEKARQGGPSGAVENAAAAVADLDKVDAPQAPSTDALGAALGMNNALKLDIQNDLSTIGKDIQTSMSESLKERADKKEKAEKSEKTDQEQQQKELEAFMKQVGIAPKRDRNGNFEGFYLMGKTKGQNGKSKVSFIGQALSPDKVRQMYEDYKTQRTQMQA